LNAAVKKKTNDGVRFKIYPGGVLGDEKDMRRKMHVGQIQGAVFTSTGLSGIFSEMDVFQIPFLFKSYDEVDYVVEKMDTFFRTGGCGLCVAIRRHFSSVVHQDKNSIRQWSNLHGSSNFLKGVNYNQRAICRCNHISSGLINPLNLQLCYAGR